MDEQRQQLQSAATSAEQLARIAAERPDLYVDIARHPNAYPALLNWLADRGGEPVRQAIAQRASTTPTQALPEAAPTQVISEATPTSVQPRMIVSDGQAPSAATGVGAQGAADGGGDTDASRPAASRKGLWITLGVIGGVAVLAAVAIILLSSLFGRGAQPEAAVASSSPAQTAEPSSETPTAETPEASQDTAEPSADGGESSSESATTASTAFCDAYETLAGMDPTSLQLGSDTSAYVDALRTMATEGPADHEELYTQMADLYQAIQDQDVTAAQSITNDTMSDFVEAFSEDAISCVTG